MHYDVVIATPGSTFKSAYVKSLVETIKVLNERNISFTFLNRYSSFVATARELTAIDSDSHDYETNKLANGRFFYDRVIWIDSDIEWTPDDFLKLMDSPHDIVSGLYQLDDNGTVAVGYPNESGQPTRVHKVEFLLHSDPVEVGSVGFGFLSVKFGVFEELPRPWFLIAKMQIDRMYQGKPLKVNLGEDYSWCELAKAHGFKIYVDPTVKVKHHKETVYTI